MREPTSGDLDTDARPGPLRRRPVGTGNERGSLATAQLLVDRREQVESAVRIAVGVSIVVMLLASLFIWLAAGRAMAPLQALARTARQISETDLSRRIPVRGNDEIAQLGRTLNAMLDRLEAAFADQREFLADVSHELRTPITVIRGHLETLGDDPSERREAVMVIQDELDRMNRFVDDLLLLVRASRPDFLRPEPLDLDLLTHEVFAKARLLGDRAWVLEGTGLGLIEGDSQRLTQAVTNLAANAANHTGPGEPIWIGSSLGAAEARLWVRDEGPGIPAEEQRLIFERFARSQSVRGTGGAGLGLAIVKAVAEAHGGHVELESSLGQGARFTIVIPALSQPAQARSAPRSAMLRRDADPDRRGRGAPGLVPGEGTALERLHDHGRRRTGLGPRSWRATTSSTCSSSTSGCPARTASRSSATCGPPASGCR